MYHNEDPILDPIIKAFTDIERKDLRVNRVVLEESKYWKLITSRKYLLSAIELNMDLVYREPYGSLENVPIDPHRFKLFGVPLENGKENKVFSEEGFIASCSAEINFGLSRFKKNYIILVKSRADFIINAPKNELCAIDTLREMITEAEYRRYMVHSFITVTAMSGKIYQIFRNDNHIRIWKDGLLIEELCIYIKDRRIPPTDKVVTLKVMLETDEESIRKSGNIYKMNKIAA